MVKNTLLVDGGEDSKIASKLLKLLGVDFESTNFETDGEIKPPVLFISEGYLEGLHLITPYAVTAYV